jgi:hypothetical protein
MSKALSPRRAAYYHKKWAGICASVYIRTRRGEEIDFDGIKDRTESWPSPQACNEVVADSWKRAATPGAKLVDVRALTASQSMICYLMARAESGARNAA